MVNVTKAAAALLEAKREKHHIPETHGVRIYERADTGDHPRVRLAMTFVPKPETNDRRVEEHGLQFFLAPEVREPLQSLVIDATEQRPYRLRLRSQAESADVSAG